MRKLLVALMMVAFAATAFAADITFSGAYEVSGKYLDNVEGSEDSDYTQRFYEHDFDLWLNAQVDKDTFFKAKFEFLDGTWEGSPASDGDYADQTQFSVQRAWMGHNFGSVLLEVGLMNGGGWSYNFGNNVEGKYRIKATIPVTVGKVIAFVQKSSESNNIGDYEDKEKDDGDLYALGYTGKFSGITVAPLFTYANNSQKVKGHEASAASYSLDPATGLVVMAPATAAEAGDNDGETVISFDLAVGGDLGAVGFEFEFDYDDVSTDVTAAEDYSTYGIYGNIYTKVAGAKLGFITAYSSFDEDAGKAYDMADDFDDDLLFVLGDEGYLANALGISGYSGLAGVWVNGIYASYDVNAKINITGGAFYAMSTLSDTAYEDASAYEIDVMASYAITDAMSYSVKLGYADIDTDTNQDVDPALALINTLSLSF
jgi:hypothetical protein